MYQPEGIFNGKLMKLLGLKRIRLLATCMGIRSLLELLTSSDDRIREPVLRQMWESDAIRNNKESK